jgi:hypothetical protein
MWSTATLTSGHGGAAAYNKQHSESLWRRVSVEQAAQRESVAPRLRVPRKPLEVRVPVVLVDVVRGDHDAPLEVECLVPPALGNEQHVAGLE